MKLVNSLANLKEIKLLFNDVWEISLWMVREGKNACDECSLNECTSCECLRLLFNNVVPTT